MIGVIGFTAPLSRAAAKVIALAVLPGSNARWTASLLSSVSVTLFGWLGLKVGAEANASM